MSSLFVFDAKQVDYISRILRSSSAMDGVQKILRGHISQLAKFELWDQAGMLLVDDVPMVKNHRTAINSICSIFGNVTEKGSVCAAATTASLLKSPKGSSSSRDDPKDRL